MGKEVVIDNNIVEFDLEKVIIEGLKHIQEMTSVKCEYISNDGKSVKVKLDGNQNAIATALERMEVRNDIVAVSNTVVDKMKVKIQKDLSTYLAIHKPEVKVSLENYDDKFGDIVFIYYNVKVAILPDNVKIKINVKVYEDNHIEFGYTIVGDKENDEYWSSTYARNIQDIAAKIEAVSKYYKSLLEE